MPFTSDILVYVSDLDMAGTRLLSALESVTSQNDITIVRSMENLSRILAQPLACVSAAVILISSDWELGALGLLQDRIVRIPTILILPDKKEQSVKLGYRLRPKFLGYAEDDFFDMQRVFENIVNKSKSYLN